MVMLGIDFGTSSTVAVVGLAGGRAVPLLFGDSPLLPSAVFAGQDGALAVGRDAVQSSRGRPDAFEPHPKSRIDDGEVLLGGRAVPVAELVAAVLRRVHDEAVRVAGGPVDRLVLTHPTGWGAHRRQTLSDAAAVAGLPPPALVAEPVAAAAYYVHILGQALPTGDSLAVYDFGAGTFDATVVRRTDGGFEVLSEAGIGDVGGLDVDAAVVAYLGAIHGPGDPHGWARLTAPVTAADRRAARTFWDDVRLAKEALSRTASATVFVPILELEVVLGREHLEQLARPLLDRTVAATRQAVLTAEAHIGHLTSVFLVGGSSRMPLCTTLLHRALGVAPTVIEQPELIVAAGALHVGAVHAAPRLAGGFAAAPVSPATEPGRQHSFGLVPPAQTAASPAPVSPPLSVPPGPVYPVSPGPAYGVPPRPERAPAPVPRPRGAASGPAALRPVRGSGPRPRLLWLLAVGAVLLVLGAAVLVALQFRPGAPVADRIATLTEHTTDVWALAFSSDGRIMATGDKDGNLVLWDVSIPAVPARLSTRKEPSAVETVTFGPGGRMITVSGTLHRWDVTDPSAPVTVAGLPAGGPPVRGAALNGAGTILATADVLGGSALWDPAGPTPSRLAELTALDARAGVSMAFSPDGKILAAAGFAGTVLWDVTSRGKPDRLGALVSSTGIGVASVTFTPDGEILATSDLKGTVDLWAVADPAAPVRRATLTAKDGGASSVAFGRQGTTMVVAAGSLSPTLKVWDVTDPTDPQQLGSLSPVGKRVAFHPDGRTFATAGTSGTITLWQLRDR